MRKHWLVVPLLAVAALAASAAARTSFPPGVPPKAKAILERDWCSDSSYRQARSVPGVTKDGRESLREAQHVADSHPAGCRRAERAAQRRASRFPRHFPYTRHTRRGDCPVGAMPVRTADRAAAGSVAAASWGRAMRPVIVGYGERSAQVRYMCGGAIARRTMVVGITLTALLPSASASSSILAVAHIRHHGWQVFAILH